MVLPLVFSEEKAIFTDAKPILFAMASRKNLKKTVNYIVDELCTECFIQEFVKKADEEKVNEILTDIMALQTEFLARCSHTEPGNVKGFYKKFYDDFNAQTDAIVAKIAAL